eukprot:Pgem_evm1s10632
MLSHLVAAALREHEKFQRQEQEQELLRQQQQPKHQQEQQQQNQIEHSHSQSELQAYNHAQTNDDLSSLSQSQLSSPQNGDSDNYDSIDSNEMNVENC